MLWGKLIICVCLQTYIQTDRAVNRNSEELRAIMCNGSCLVIYEKTSLWAVVAWKM